VVVRYWPEIVLWWAACLGLWLLTLSSITLPELVVGAVAALPCAVLAVLARRAVQGSWPARPAWIRWLLPLPVAVVADSVRVLGLAAGVLIGRRIPDGELRRLRFPRDEDAGSRRTREAVAVLLVNTSPGTVVLDIDDSGEMLLHSLGGGRPRMEEVVRR
jgi:multisubunit Na+/H+ antiporter MnhE subunit